MKTTLTVGLELLCFVTLSVCGNGSSKSTERNEMPNTPTYMSHGTVSQYYPHAGFGSRWRHFDGRNMSAGVSSSGSNSGSGSGCGSDSSSGNNDIFSYFGRQQQAFEYYDMLSFNNEHEQQQQQMQQPVIKGLKLYSFERDSDGQRKFLVSTWSRFLDECLSYTNNHGHFYEIIREHTPCRLYFDLEYPICVSSGREHMLTNGDVDGDAIVAKFINLVVWKLHELLGICVDDENVIVLDSSSERKFSKHIIISMHSNAADCALWNAAVTRTFDTAEECLFQDNVEINKLIDHIFDEIYRSRHGLHQCHPVEATKRKPVFLIQIKE
jgi:hypothetical protein